MPYETITLAVADRIATVTVNRPDKLNALNDRVDRRAGRRDRRGRIPDVAGVILTGAGRAFVAGADISELEHQGAVSCKALAQRGQEVFRRFETSPKPTIAAVNGFALGGGCELAMACHIRIASDAAKFGQPEVKLGMVPGLRRHAAPAAARRQGTRAAAAAHRRDDRRAGGAAHRPRQPRRPGRRSHRDGDGDAARPFSPTARSPWRTCIEVVNAGYDLPLADALTLEATAFGLLAATDDKREGTRAFLEKRAAKFTGA